MNSARCPHEFDFKAAVSGMPVKDVPGSYPRNPLKGLKASLGQCESYYLSKKAEAGGAHVFKARQGIPAIVLTDMTSVRFLYQCPRSVLDRGEPNTFGPLVGDYSGRSYLLITSKGKDHDTGRAFFDKLLQIRDTDLLKNLEKTYEQCTEQWLKRKRFKLCIALQELIATAGFAWLFDVSLDPKHLKEAAFNEFYYLNTLRTDSWLFNTFLSPLIKVKLSDEVIASRAYCVDQIRKSKNFDQYVEMAKSYSMPIVDLEYLLASSTALNFYALRLVLMPILAQITVNTPIKDRLSEELSGVEEFNRAVLLDGLPWLDSIFREGKRLYPRPRYTYRYAQQDFNMPAADGYAYAIKKGNCLVAVNTLVYRDIQVFGNNADLFYPQRFLDEPKLKGITELTWGYPAMAEKSTYSCPAAKTRQAEFIMKYILARLFREFEWQFTDVTRFRPDYYTEVNPDLTIDNFRRKSVGRKGA